MHRLFTQNKFRFAVRPVYFALIPLCIKGFTVVLLFVAFYISRLGGLTLSLLFASCEKDDITVNLNQSGTVEVKAIGLNNEPLVDATVIIEDGYVVFEGKTDSKGICKSEKLLQGNYTCSVEAAQGKAIYFDYKNLQVITDENRKIELNPLANSGNITINLLDYYYAPVNGIFSVALVPYNMTPTSIEDIESVAYFVLTTDSAGKVTFPNVPTETRYRLFAYKSNVLYHTFYYNPVYAEKGQNKTIVVELSNY